MTISIICKHIKYYCSIGEKPMIQDNGKSNNNPAYFNTESLHALSNVSELLHLVIAHISVSLNKETLAVSYLVTKMLESYFF